VGGEIGAREDSGLLHSGKEVKPTLSKQIAMLISAIDEGKMEADKFVEMFEECGKLANLVIFGLPNKFYVRDTD
jgi:hypothetical protein